MVVAPNEAVLQRRSDGLAVTGELHRHMDGELSRLGLFLGASALEIVTLDVDGTVDLHEDDECLLAWSRGTAHALVAVIGRDERLNPAAIGQAAIDTGAPGNVSSRIWLAISAYSTTQPPAATPALNPPAMALAAALPHLDDIRDEIRKMLAGEIDQLADALLRALLGEVDRLGDEIQALIEGPAEPPGWRQRIGDGLRSLGRFGKRVRTVADTVHLGELLVQAAEHAKDLGDEWLS